ncbi:MAG: hypothetical protein Kow0090_06870 [Myxococcota bacterium]
MANGYRGATSRASRWDDKPFMTARKKTGFLIKKDGERVAIESASLAIGSGEECDLRIKGKDIPPLAAKIERQGGAFVFKRTSELPCSINGRDVKELWLRNDDEIVISNHQFQFKITENEKTIEEPAPERTAVRAETEVGIDLAETPLPPDIPGLKKELKKLKIALSIGRAIAKASSENEIFSALLDECFRLIAADFGAILVPDDGEKFQTLLCRKKNGELIPTSEAELSSTAIELALKNRKGLLVDDIGADERFDLAQSVVELNIRSVLVVPIKAGESLFAIIHLDSREKKGGFAEGDLEILSVIATQAGIALDNIRLRREQEREIAFRKELTRYLAPQVVEQVLNKEAVLASAQGQRLSAAALFIDIRDFTGLARAKTPEQLVSLLNEFFGAMAEIVLNHGGFLDKFIGDALMAVWGVPIGDYEPAMKAVEAALDMQGTLLILNRAREERGEEAIHAGIGIEKGTVVAGNIGSSRRLEYTVIGDAANIASRLCQKAQAGEILIGETVYNSVKETFGCEPLEPITFKGFTEPIRPYRIVERRGEHRFI